MARTVLLNKVSANTDSDAIEMNSGVYGVFCYADDFGACTVKLELRDDPGSPWVDVTSGTFSSNKYINMAINASCQARGKLEGADGLTSNVSLTFDGG